jgi:hypothetical protein
MVINAKLSISEVNDYNKEIFETYEKYMKLLLHTLPGRNLGGAVSAFAELGSGDQIRHHCWSQCSSTRQCKYGNG